MTRNNVGQAKHDNATGNDLFVGGRVCLTSHDLTSSKEPTHETGTVPTPAVNSVGVFFSGPFRADLPNFCKDLQFPTSPR